MTDPATGQRSFLQALRVPFDLKGIGLGMLAWLALVWGGRLIGDHPMQSHMTVTLERLGTWTVDLDNYRRDGLLFLALVLAVAAVFGVACCRIAAMRISRDEGVDLGAALGFSAGNVGSTLGAYLFLAGALGGPYACNALAGLLSGIPGIGPILMILLFPLALLSTLVLFLFAFGTALGFPLMLAGLATERNGALDAVSRGFSYVFSRPVLFLAYGFTVWFVAGLLKFCAASMMSLVAWSFTHWFPDGDSYRALDGAIGTALARAADLRLWDSGGAEGMAVLGGWVAWLFGTLFHLALMGYVVYYFFGGATAAYFALRRDVDGTEDEEIWVEGEEGPGFGEPERPEPAPAPPGGKA